MDINYIRSEFFSKPTISSINKLLIQQLNLTNISKDIKKNIIDTLINNMKHVYKNMNTSKININNFDSIFEQFKNFSLSETVKELKKQDNIIIKNQSTFDNNNNNIKYIRDFSTAKNDGNKIMDRPASTKTINTEEILSKNDVSSNDLNQAFAPIISDIKDNYFNNYSYGKGDTDKDRVSSLQQQRQLETHIDTKPEMPDFLKSQETSVKKNTNEQNNNVQFK